MYPLHLIVFQGSSSVILDPLPQQRDHGALHGALQRTLGRLGLVDDCEGELGAVLPALVPDDQAVVALVLLGDAVEYDLGVTLQVHDGDGLALLQQVLALVPGHLGGGLSVDGHIKL